MKQKNLTQQMLQRCYRLLLVTMLHGLIITFSATPALTTEIVTKETFLSETRIEKAYMKLWNDILPAEQERLLHYFAIGKENKLNNEQLEDLGSDLVAYFGYVQRSINYINNPSGKYTGGLGKRVLGKQIEKLIPQVGTIFSDKGKQLDDAIKSIMTEHLRKSDETLRKQDETLKVLNETLKILEQIQKSF